MNGAQFCRLAGCLGLLWALWLPSGSAQDIRIAHCLFGCPVGAGADNHLIVRPIYALSYNEATKSADWVAYRVSEGAIGIASSLSRLPRTDDYVADTLQAADFTGLDELGLVRAQYVPLVDFAGTPFWPDVNYLTNSVARTASLSQGAWYGLDWSIRNLVNRTGDAYVVAGPIYYASPTSPQLPIPTPHRVPDAFFKVVVSEAAGAAAFLFEQDTAVHVHHCDRRSSLVEIEDLTGLALFPDAPQGLSEQFYSQLGCY